MDRLLNAYQEGLASLGQLRCRMPKLRKQQQAVQTELQSLATTASGQAQCLRLVESLADFRSLLQMRADTLEVTEQQKILRLLVKEILVGKETLTIRHSIRIPASGSDPSAMPRPPHLAPQPPTPQPGPHYLLRSDSHQPSVSQSVSALCL